MPQSVQRHRSLILIVVLYAILALGYSAIVPLGEAPDEVDHFLYIQHLARERRFPILRPVAEENVTMEANQPPLYYMMNALLVAPIKMNEAADYRRNSCFTFDTKAPGRQHFYLHSMAERFPYRGSYLAFHLARVLSVLMGAATVLMTYVLGRQLAPEKQHIALLAASLLALNPQFIFVTASVNNDVLGALLGAAIVAMSVAACRRPDSRTFAGLGLLTGLALLTKFALLALWPLALLAGVLPSLGPWRARPSSPSLVARLALVAGIPVLVAGWWYWRANQIYGDPLAWRVHLLAKNSQVVRVDPFRPADLLEFITVHFQSYWGWFGWLKIKEPGWVYWALSGMTLAAVAGVAMQLRGWRVKSGRPAAGSSPGAVPNDFPRIALLLNLLAVSAVYISLLRYIQTINWSGYQGRLAYSVSAPIAVLLAFGLGAWSKCPLRLLSSWIIPVSLLALSIGSLLGLIVPAYPRPEIYQPAPDVARICAQVAPELLIEGYVTPESVKPGDSLQLTVYGYGLRSSAARTFRLEIAGRAGATVAEAQAELSWVAGEVVSVTLPMHVAADAQPARAVLLGGLLNQKGEWQELPTTARPLPPAPLAIGTLKISPKTRLLPTPQTAVQANFSGQMALVGYDLAIDVQTATVTLYWESLSFTPYDFTTFVHLLDSQGRLVAQDDGQPQAGEYPTSIWSPGEFVADRKVMQIPAGLSMNPHRIAVGVYLLETLTRLPVRAAAGLPLPDDRFVLPALIDR